MWLFIVVILLFFNRIVCVCALASVCVGRGSGNFFYIIVSGWREADLHVTYVTKSNLEANTRVPMTSGEGGEMECGLIPCPTTLFHLVVASWKWRPRSPLSPVQTPKRVYWFPRATVTNYRKFGGFKKTNFSQFWGQMSIIKGPLKVPLPLKVLGENNFMMNVYSCLIQPLVALGVAAGLQSASVFTKPSLHLSFHCVSLTRILVIRYRLCPR